MFRFAQILLALLIGAMALPLAASAKPTVKPKLTSVAIAGQNLTIKGSVKLPAKKSLKGKSLKVRVTLTATTGKPVTKSTKIKAKKKPATVKFRVSLRAEAIGKLKITAQVYAGKKKLGKSSKARTVNVASDPPAGEPGFTPVGLSVSVGWSTSCTQVGPDLKCWGTGGNVGSGTTTGSQFPAVVIPGLQSSLVSFSAGGAGGCALVNGYAKCWGDNTHGELGNGLSGSVNSSTTPVQVQGITGGGRSISMGNQHACAVNNAKIQCWGRNDFGQLGNGTDNGNSNIATPTPQDVVNTGDQLGFPYSVAVGGLNSCANTSTGIWCWGQNYQGQLGDDTHPTVLKSNVPVHVKGVLEGISHITNFSLSVGNNHVCAQLGGHPYCWGSNEAGQLGKPLATTMSDVPVTPDGLPIIGVNSVSAGESYTCSQAFEVAKCWGRNDLGQLGTGATSAPVPTPQTVLGLESNAGSVAAGMGGHACGSRAGTILCWGAAGGGFYLGNGATTNQPTPAPVQGL